MGDNKNDNNDDNNYCVTDLMNKNFYSKPSNYNSMIIIINFKLC